MKDHHQTIVGLQKNQIKKSLLIINEQGVYAFSNFIIIIFLSKWSTDDALGYFATVYSLIILYSAIQSAALTDPLLININKYYINLERAYIKKSTSVFFISCLLPIITIPFFLQLKNNINMLGFTIGIYLLIFSPFMLTLPFLRKLFLSTGLIKYSVFTGYTYLVIIVSLFFAIKKASIFSIENAIICIGLSSFLSSLIGFSFLFKNLPEKSAKNSKIKTIKILAENHEYARWAILTAFISWIPNNIYFLFFSLLGKPEISGSLKLITNMASPLLQVNMAINNYFTYNFSKEKLNIAIIKKYYIISKKSKKPLIIASTLNAFIIYIVFFFFYKDSLSIDKLTILLIFLMTLVHSFLSIKLALYKSLNLSKEIFKSFILGSIFSMSLGLIISYQLNINGTLFSILVSYLIGYYYLTTIFLRKTQ